MKDVMTIRIGGDLKDKWIGWPKLPPGPNLTCSRAPSANTHRSTMAGPGHQEGLRQADAGQLFFMKPSRRDGW